MATMFGDVTGSSSVTTHKIYLILQRRFKGCPLMATSFSCNTFFGGEGRKESRFYPFYRSGKIAIQTGPALFQLQGKDCSTTSPARLARLYFTSTTRLHLGRLKQYPKDKRPEYNERSANLICNLVNNRIILSSRYLRYCGSFLWKRINEK